MQLRLKTNPTASCNNDELANHVLAHEEEYAKAGNAIDFLEMMADFKNEFEW